jgi:exodeoxyribonuclease VII small subunit
MCHVDTAIIPIDSKGKNAYGDAFEKLRKSMAKAATSSPDALKDLSFEQALKELETIVRGLESGQVDLEKSIADYTRGAQLKEHCLKKLNEAKLKVEQITKQADGSLGVTAFDTKE